jgi:hypothetical protein
MIKINKRILKYSEIAAIFAVLIGTVLFIYEIFGHPSEHIHHIIDHLELFFCFIFFAEIGLHFVDADNKLIYLRKNWFYILTITPFARIFKAFGLLHLAESSRIMRYLAFGMEDGHAASIIFRRFALIKEASFIAYHLKKCNLPEVPQKFDYRYVNIYISPHADPNAVKGIKRGMQEYAALNLRLHLIFKKKKWIEAFKIEQKCFMHDHDFIDSQDLMGEMEDSFMKDWNIIITDEKLKYQFLQVHGRFEKASGVGQGVFSTHAITHPHAYEHLAFDMFKELRGYVIANHVFKEFQDRILNGKTVQVLTPDRVDLLSFLAYKNGQYTPQ